MNALLLCNKEYLLIGNNRNLIRDTKDFVFIFLIYMVRIILQKTMYTPNWLSNYSQFSSWLVRCT